MTLLDDRRLMTGRDYGHLSCMSCRAELTAHGTALRCRDCGRQYAVREGIPSFTAGDEYWCNVPRERMLEVLERAEAVGWREAVHEMIPHCELAIAPLYRADAQFLLPLSESSRVLDAGSMWGGLTIPLAQYCGEVHAVDKTWETLRLTEIRARQLGLDNVVATVAPIQRLPFPDDFFDVAVLNGVLEWLGYEETYIVDEHWGTRRSDAASYAATPRAMQLQALRELRRVIKPEGTLYVAIENRIGLQYFLGHPDDHMNVRFLPFLPRNVANLLNRFWRGTEYRTYVYSPRQLQRLLAEAGFPRARLHAAHPHYGKIWRLVPFEIFDSVRGVATTAHGRWEAVAFSQAWKRTPRFLTKWMSPSLAVVADSRDETQVRARVLRVLADWDVLPDAESGRYRPFIMNSRFDDRHAVLVPVFDTEQGRPVLMCKLGRVPDGHSLADESAILRELGGRLGEEEIQTVPRLVRFGLHEGVPVQVMTLLPGSPSGKNIWEGLRRAGRFVPSRGPLRPLLSASRSVGSALWRRSNQRIFAHGVDLLARLQRLTTDQESLDLGELTDRLLPAWLESAQPDPGVRKTVLDVLRRLGRLKGTTLPLCFVHGDYDICNVLDQGRRAGIVDFEHASFGGLPLFDLGNFLFSPLVMEWRDVKDTEPLVDYARTSGWQTFVVELVERYAAASGVPPGVLAELPTLVVLEQQAIQYPPNRDPMSYPMRGDSAVREMVGWRLPLSPVSKVGA